MVGGFWVGYVLVFDLFLLCVRCLSLWGGLFLEWRFVYGLDMSSFGGGL